MKKVMMAILAALLVVLPVEPTFAASGNVSFAMISGNLAHPDSNSPALISFWQSIRIEVADQGGEMMPFYVSHSVALDRDANFTSYTGEGYVDGVYNPQTGELSGKYQITIVSESSREMKGHKPYHNTFTTIYSGRISAFIKPGDTSVTVNFSGKWDQKAAGTMPNGQPVEENMTFVSNWGFDVTFAIEGEFPVPQETPAPSVVTTNLEDSGARFSDFSGQVEVLYPKGYDADGKPVYDEEAWTFAKLDMPLPADARIKTQDKSSVILSFADMTTFEMKPETEIILSSPSAKDSQLKLLVGNLWVNIKKMAKDGSMDIEMSQAIAGARGTTFVLENDGETSTLKVIEGTVEYTSKATDKSVMVEGGKMVSATADGLGDIKDFDVNAEMVDWEQYGAEMPSKGFPLWAILTISGGALIVILIVAIVAITRKNRRAALSGCPYPTYTAAAYPPPARGKHPSTTPGASAQMSASFCTQCGTMLLPGAAFCPNCGKRKS